MKKLRLLTVSTMLLAGSMAAFTSCGGGDDEKSGDDKPEAKKETKTGASEVAAILKDFESGKITFGETSAAELAELYGMEEDDYSMSDDVDFEGYDLEKNFGLDGDALSYMSFHTYSKGDDTDLVEKDVEAIVKEMKDIFGTPDFEEGSSYDWEKEGYTVSLVTYATGGYDINVDQAEEVNSSCVGDIFTLKNDLRDIFLTNIKNGTITIGKTTSTEMASIVGDADYFDQEYDGLRVSGTMSYDGDVLSSISLDYFYDCEGAMSFLAGDKTSITDLIDTELGVTGESEGDYEDAGTDWSFNGMSISQMNFSDGYGVYFE